MHAISEVQFLFEKAFDLSKFLEQVQRGSSKEKVKDVAQKYLSGQTRKCSDASLQTLTQAYAKIKREKEVSIIKEYKSLLQQEGKRCEFDVVSLIPSLRPTEPENAEDLALMPLLQPTEPENAEDLALMPLLQPTEPEKAEDLALMPLLQPTEPENSEDLALIPSLRPTEPENAEDLALMPLLQPTEPENSEDLALIPSLRPTEPENAEDLALMPVHSVLITSDEEDVGLVVKRKVSIFEFENTVRRCSAQFKEICEDEEEEISDQDIGEYEKQREADIAQYNTDLVFSMGINKTAAKYRLMKQEIESLSDWFIRFIDRKILAYSGKVIRKEKERISGVLKDVEDFCEFEKEEKEKFEEMFTRLGDETNSGVIISSQKRCFLKWLDKEIKLQKYSYMVREIAQFKSKFDAELKAVKDLSLFKETQVQEIDALFVKIKQKIGAKEPIEKITAKLEQRVQTRVDLLRKVKINLLLSKHPEMEGLKIGEEDGETLNNRIATLVGNIAQKVKDGSKVPDCFYVEMLELIEESLWRDEWTLIFFLQKAQSFSTKEWMEKFSSEKKEEGENQIREFFAMMHPFSKAYKRDNIDKLGAFGLSLYELGYKLSACEKDLAHEVVVERVMEQTPAALFFKKMPESFFPEIFRKNLLNKLRDPLSR